MSHAPHSRRPVSTAVTVSLAGLAALITLWLGSLANLSADSSAAPVSAADQLAVVQVQAGETLQQLAQRVAPGASAAQTADRIRDLNKLDSAAIDAGQTLIAPLG
jgi:predicted Zn-dependent protease